MKIPNKYISLLYEAQLSQLELHFNIDSEEGIRQSKIALVDFFFNLQQNLIKPQLFFEIGAFTAETSLKLKRKLPETKCFAFEANIYNYNLFTRENNYEEAGINYIQAAISNKTGKEIFSIQKSISGNNVEQIRANNSLLPRSQPGVEYEKLVVNSYKLDDFIQNEKIISPSDRKISLWIDAEGAGFDVLQGAETSLAKVSSIFIEVEEKQYWEKQVLAHQIIKYLLQNNFIPVARDFEAPFQYNIIFVRAPLVNKRAYKHCRSMYYKQIRSFSTEN